MENGRCGICKESYYINGNARDLSMVATESGIVLCHRSCYDYLVELYGTRLWADADVRERVGADPPTAWKGDEKWLPPR